MARVFLCRSSFDRRNLLSSRRRFLIIEREPVHRPQGTRKGYAMSKSDHSSSSFEQIGRDIHRAVRDALREVDKTGIPKKIQKNLAKKPERTKQPSWQQIQQENKNQGVLMRTDEHGDPIAPFRGKSIGYQIVGYFIGLPMLLTSIYTTMLMLSQPIGSWSFFGMLLANLVGLYPITWFTVRTGITGIRLHYARRRFSGYWNALKKRGFASVERMAQNVGRLSYHTRKELRFMIRQGFFDKAHIDAEHDMLVINEPNFLAHKKAQMLESQKEQALEAPKEALPEPAAAPEEAARQMIAEGKSYIVQMEEIRAGIDDPEMQQDLIHLEKVTYNIFSYISRNPEKLNKIRRFMQYYLPTTVKLVHAYEELENQPVAGTNISTSKEKIKESMKTINTAFERLLDELFQKDALDIHSDLIAMETMMARDGLGGKDFIRIREEEEDLNGQE